jgi:hypothetical protein
VAGYNIQTSTLESCISCQHIHSIQVSRCTYGAGGPCRSLSTSACKRVVRTMCVTRIEICPPKSLLQYGQVFRFDLRCHDCAVVAGVEIVRRKIEGCSRFGKCVSQSALIVKRKALNENRVSITQFHFFRSVTRYQRLIDNYLLPVSQLSRWVIQLASELVLG